MIVGLRGTLERRGSDYLVLQVGGVLLKVFTSTTTSAAVGNPGEIVELHTHLYLREDLLALYGFAGTEELELFELLIGVTGIGPKAALSLLSAAAPDHLAAAIAGENVEFLTRVPGIGKKTAARVVLELKNKVVPGLTMRGTVGPATLGGGHSEVLAALTALGYTPAEAAGAISSLPPSLDLPVEERIRLALRALATR